MAVCVREVACDERIPTGVLRLGADWPGIFIRGDEALAFASEIAACIEGVKRGSLPPDQKNGRLDALLRLLGSCRVVNQED